MSQVDAVAAHDRAPAQSDLATAAYPGLDGFRALAFLAVFLGHVQLFGAGQLGVQAFFVLSGFLLTPILVQLAGRERTGRYFAVFYGRRALRILPLYYFYLLLAAALAPIVVMHAASYDPSPVREYFRQLPWALTFTYDFYHASSAFRLGTPLVTHFWSLAVEEQFYLLWPVAMLLVPAVRRRAFLVALVLLGPAVRLLIALAAEHQWWTFLSPHAALVVFVFPLSHVDAFATGGYFALFRRQCGAGAIWLGIVAVAGAGLASHALATGTPAWNALGFPFPMAQGLQYVWGYTALNLLFGAVLANVREGAFLPGVFGHSVLRYLGRISYGLYVYHLPVIWAWGVTWPSMPRWLAIPGMFAATLVISALSFHLMESRLIALKDRYFRATDRPDTAIGRTGG